MARAARAGGAVRRAATLALLVAGRTAPVTKQVAAPVRPATLGLTGASTPAIDPAWWRGFGDPQLNRLTADALADSPTFDAALARVSRPDALLGQAKPTQAFRRHSTPRRRRRGCRAATRSRRPSRLGAQVADRRDRLQLRSRPAAGAGAGNQCAGAGEARVGLCIGDRADIAAARAWRTRVTRRSRRGSAASSRAIGERMSRARPPAFLRREARHARDRHVHGGA